MTAGAGAGAGAGARADSPSFDDFVLARGPALLRLATALCGDPQLAQDVVQDVLVTAMTRWGRVGSADNLDAYVRRMVVNRLNSWWRRAARREQPRAGSDLPVVVVPDQAGPVVDRRVLVRALSTLPAKQRTVLVLRHYEGCSDAEIAELLGCPSATVRSHALRGLRTLRAALTEEVPS
jgi:RNA polymerase sigma-70 factor (sigma-E family)